MSSYLPVYFKEEDPLYVRSLGYEDKPELAHWGPGYRNYCILHYVTEGAGFYNGHRVKNGEGFFIMSDSLHEYHSDPQKPWNYFWIIFSRALAERYVLPTFQMQDNIFACPYIGKIQILVKSLFQEHKELTHVRALGVFFQLMALHEEAAKGISAVSAAHVQKAKAYIESNFHRAISVRDVADQIHIDERYMYNLFVRYEGSSPKKYISELRIELACGLLVNTDFSISEIASSVGIPDVCTFSRFFSKRMGISPSGYRERHNTF